MNFCISLVFFYIKKQCTTKSGIPCHSGHQSHFLSAARTYNLCALPEILLCVYYTCINTWGHTLYTVLPTVLLFLFKGLGHFSLSHHIDLPHFFQQKHNTHSILSCRCNIVYLSSSDGNLLCAQSFAILSHVISMSCFRSTTDIASLAMLPPNLTLYNMVALTFILNSLQTCPGISVG